MYIRAQLALENALKDIAGGVVKLPFISKGCLWTHNTSGRYIQFRPQFSFEVVTPSVASPAKGSIYRVVVIEVDQCYHVASSYTSN